MTELPELAELPEMSEAPAHFTVTDGGFMPTRFAQSHWGDDHLNGPAIVGLVARGLEKDCGSTEFRPARLTVAQKSLSRSVSARAVLLPRLPMRSVTPPPPLTPSRGLQLMFAAAPAVQTLRELSGAPNVIVRVAPLIVRVEWVEPAPHTTLART